MAPKRGTGGDSGEVSPGGREAVPRSAGAPRTDGPGGDDAPENGGDGGLRGGRRILAWIGGALAGLLVLYLAAALALRTLVPPERLASWAEPRAEAALNRDVEIGGAAVTIFPHLGVALDEFTVGNLAAFEGPPLARAERAELRVALWPLIRGDVVVDEAVLRGLDVRLQVDEDGVSNFGDLLPASDEPEPAAAADEGVPVSLAVRSVGVESSRAEYRDRQSGRLLVADGVRVRGSLSSSEAGWQVEADAGTDELTADLPSVRETAIRPGGVTLSLRARSGPDFGWVEVDEGRLSVGGVPLSLSGRVDSLRAPVRHLSLSLDADSLDLGSLAGSAPAGAIPDAVESLAGTATVRVGVTGALGEGASPETSALVRLRGAGATVAGRGRVAEGLSGTLRVRGDTAGLEDLEGSVLGGPFRASGAVSLDSARAFTARLESTVSLSSLLPEGTGGAASGTVEAALDLSGQGGDASGLEVSGPVALREITLPADSPRAPVRVPRGELSFEGRSVTWSGLPLVIGEDRVTTQGRVDGWTGLVSEDAGVPTLRASAEASRLDLDRLLPKPDGSPTWGQLVFARLGRDSVGGRPTAEVARELGYTRPTSLPAAGEVEVSVDTLVFRPYRIRPATVRIEFGPELIRLSPAELGLFGGTLEQTLSVSLGEGAQSPFSMSLTGRGLRAADFLETTSPMGRLLTGTMGLDLEATGRLDGSLLPVRDSLLGRGVFTADGGGLRENPLTGALAGLLSYPALRSPSVERVRVPFRVQGTTVRFDTARLTTGAGGLSWAGSMDLAGGLDLGSRLQVPRSRIQDLSLEGAGLAGDLLSRLQQGDGPLELGIGVGGSVASPRVQLDTDALRARAEASVRDAAEEEVRKRIDQGRGELEKRARGLLQRLTGGRDTADADTADSDTAGAADPDTSSAPRLR